MKKIKIIIAIFLFVFYSTYSLSNDGFENWKINFQNLAKDEGISLKTLNLINNSKFLPNVIKYDRYQPEFYEDTKTYILKRTSKKKLSVGSKTYFKNSDNINFI